MSLEAEYLKCRRQAQVGCAFARLIAVRPGNYGQVLERVPSAGSPGRVATAIAARIDKLLADPNATAAILLLPDVTTLEKLTMVALALRDQPEWSVTTSKLNSSPVGEMTAVHISRAIPFGSKSCPSEALVFGPYAEFPPTRIAPSTGFEIFVGEPLTHDPKAGTPTLKANFAHMDVRSGLPTPAAFVRTWNNSVDGRLKSLGGIDDSRAKAKIAFVIPNPLAESLGCAP